jgi:hypothetical protein
MICQYGSVEPHAFVAKIAVYGQCTATRSEGAREQMHL